MDSGGSQLEIQQARCRRMRSPTLVLLTALLIVIAVTTGCHLTPEQSIRRLATVASWGPGDVIDVRHRKSPIALPARNWFAKAPQPSPRTEQLLA